MARQIPLIRADVLLPVMHWMARNGRSVEPRLADAGLEWFPLDDPGKPVPILPSARLLAQIARLEGPDFPCRVVDTCGVVDIGIIARAAATGGTLRGVLREVAALMPFHCTHEMIVVTSDGGDCIIRDHWTIPIPNEEIAHFMQQYVAAIVLGIARLTPSGQTHFRYARMRPHPTHGLNHLRSRFAPAMLEAGRENLLIRIPSDVADQPSLPQEPSPHEDEAFGRWHSLRGDGSLSASVALLMRSMLGGEVPTVERIASYAGMSRRSFQRALSDEGMTFSELLDRERHHFAIAHMDAFSGNLEQLARSLGFAQPGSFSRAFRRWTGQTPLGHRYARQ